MRLRSMRPAIDAQLEETRGLLDELEHQLDGFKLVYGVGASRVAAELAGINLRLTKLLNDERLCLGTPKPHGVP
jgi:hypothetical protein